MEGHIGGQIDKLKCTVSYRWTSLMWPDLFPVLHKRLCNTEKGLARLQMDSNIVVCPATPNFMSLLIAAEVGSSGPD